jgi:hypothetical protein
LTTLIYMSFEVHWGPDSGCIVVISLYLEYHVFLNLKGGQSHPMGYGDFDPHSDSIDLQSRGITGVALTTMWVFKNYVNITL